MTSNGPTAPPTTPRGPRRAERRLAPLHRGPSRRVGSQAPRACGQPSPASVCRPLSPSQPLWLPLSLLLLPQADTLSDGNTVASDCPRVGLGAAPRLPPARRGGAQLRRHNPCTANIATNDYGNTHNGSSAPTTATSTLRQPVTTGACPPRKPHDATMFERGRGRRTSSTTTWAPPSSTIPPSRPPSTTCNAVAACPTACPATSSAAATRPTDFRKRATAAAKCPTTSSAAATATTTAPATQLFRTRHDPCSNVSRRSLQQRVTAPAAPRRAPMPLRQRGATATCPTVCELLDGGYYVSHDFTTNMLRRPLRPSAPCNNTCLLWAKGRRSILTQGPF